MNSHQHLTVRRWSLRASLLLVLSSLAVPHPAQAQCGNPGETECGWGCCNLYGEPGTEVCVDHTPSGFVCCDPTLGDVYCGRNSVTGEVGDCCDDPNKCNYKLGRCCHDADQFPCGVSQDCCALGWEKCSLPDSVGECVWECPASTQPCGEYCCDQSQHCNPTTLRCEDPPEDAGSGNNPDNCLQVGDPVELERGASYLSRTDVDLDDPRLNIQRFYNSNPEAWLHDTPLTNIPSPFGKSPFDELSLEWWHSYFSMVTLRGNYWVVRTRKGELERFEACASGECLPSKSNHATDYRLINLAPGFLLLSADGTRYSYHAIHKDGTETRYFLSSIHDATGIQLAGISYAPPPGLSCPSGAAGSTPGVPYIAEIITATATIAFQYSQLPSNHPGASECVLRRLERSIVGDPNQPFVTYSYWAPTGTTEVAGRVGRATSAAAGEEVYNYTSNSFQVLRDGHLVSSHMIASGRVTGDSSNQGSLAITYGSTPGTCYAESECCWQGGPGIYARLPTVRTVTHTSASLGDGTGTPASFSQEFSVLEYFGQRLAPVLYELRDSCSLNPQACSEGTIRYERSCPADGGLGSLIAKKDKRDNWEQYEWGLSSPDAGLFRRVAERRKVLRGASGLTAQDALESTRYEYIYGQREAQLLSRELEPSVLFSGADARTRHVYDSNNRLEAIIRSGWTKDLAGTLSERHVATFFRKQHFCGGAYLGAPDPHNRTLQIDGPCFVTSDTATACDSSIHPIRRFDYWPSDGSLRSNRLKSTSDFPNGCTAPAVTTLFDDYDTWGNVTRVIDPNGVIISRDYSGHHLVEETVATNGPTTKYFYEKGKLVAIQKPEQNFEVFCYRDGSGSTCDGNWTDNLMWKAKASALDGSDWAEKVFYTYWPDGSLKSESFWIPGQQRRTKLYALDAQGRHTFERTGNVKNQNEFVQAYDRADNVVGIGFAYNNPPSWCGGVVPGAEHDTAISNLCTRLAYDRANRLVLVTEASTGSSTRMAYDVQGNLCAVTIGASGSWQASCSYTGPADHDKTLYYSHDDFGNVVEFTDPASGGGLFGPTRMEYSAGGALLRKQTAQMRADGEWLAIQRDMLDRVVSATAQTMSGSTLLYRLTYDSPALSQDCLTEAGLVSTADALAMGRLALREDSFGKTHYVYNKQGLTVAELRERHGSAIGCDGLPYHPHTRYGYDLNGNLTAIEYPHGRTIFYRHGTGGLRDRIVAVDVSMYDGSAWAVLPDVISNVHWEPYAGLRAYEINDGTANVEYMLGDNGHDPPPPQCASTLPLAGDATGRLRSLRVTTGALVPGAGLGDILRVGYQWSADQIVRTESCLMVPGQQGAPPRVEEFAYDSRLRLGEHHRSTPDSSAYAYDSRDNLVSYAEQGISWNPVYSSTNNPDFISQLDSQPAPELSYAYTHDSSGRTTSKRWAWNGHELGFSYGLAAGQSAVETVFSALNVAGGEYGYYYDAFGRRRLKEYPTLNVDEFFYDLGTALLSDQGNSHAISAPSYHVVDDYIWLGGRPVAVARGRLTTSWARQSDSSTACGRNGESASCGIRFPVTDHIGKPVLMMDASGRVTGIGHYDSFGRVNWVSLHHASSHPYEPKATHAVSEEVQHWEPQTDRWQYSFRLDFHGVDLPDPAACLGPADEVLIYDVADPSTPVESIRASGRHQTNWLQFGERAFSVYLEAHECEGVHNGALLEGYEYRMWESGAAGWFFTPLRFPGQYYDEESGLHENWHRYYDPGIGRYLQPEPLLQDPRVVVSTAMRGMSMPAYAYAMNNPMYFTDPNGLYPFPWQPGKLCVSSTCKPGDNNDCKDLPEDSPKNNDPGELKNLPAPGTCTDSDAIYTDSGVIKIPNHCKCTVECDGNGRQSINCVCFPGMLGWKGPQEFDENKKLPGGWPQNPFIP